MNVHFTVKRGIKMDQAKKVLIVIAPQTFRDEEYQKPRAVLEEAGAAITVTSKGVSTATGRFGARVAVDQDISQVSAKDYDAVVFVGGPGASVYFDDPIALNLAQEAYNSIPVIAAICIAPSILANAGLLRGKQATAFPSEKQNLQAKGATYTGKPVTTDGKIITASGPEAAREFGKAIASALGL
jgi:protease I